MHWEVDDQTPPSQYGGRWRGVISSTRNYTSCITKPIQQSQHHVEKVWENICMSIVMDFKCDLQSEGIYNEDDCFGYNNIHTLALSIFFPRVWGPTWVDLTPWTHLCICMVMVGNLALLFLKDAMIQATSELSWRTLNIGNASSQRILYTQSKPQKNMSSRKKTTGGCWTCMRLKKLKGKLVA